MLRKQSMLALKTEIVPAIKPAQERFAQEQGVKAWSKLLEAQQEVQATMSYCPTNSSAHAWRNNRLNGSAGAYCRQSTSVCFDDGFDDQATLLALLSHFDRLLSRVAATRWWREAPKNHPRRPALATVAPNEPGNNRQPLARRLVTVSCCHPCRRTHFRERPPSAAPCRWPQRPAPFPGPPGCPTGC